MSVQPLAFRHSTDPLYPGPERLRAVNNLDKKTNPKVLEDTVRDHIEVAAGRFLVYLEEQERSYTKN